MTLPPHPLPRFWVGLGNEGHAFTSTRHNLGRQLLEGLRATLGWPAFRRAAEAPVYCSTGPSGNLQLLFPKGFMNLSGGPIARFLPKNWDKEQGLCVLHDDLEVPLGKARWKYGGSHHGHNGLRSLIEHLHTRDFWRLRLGIGRPPAEVSVESYVLGAPEGEDREKTAQFLDHWQKSLAKLVLDAIITS